MAGQLELPAGINVVITCPSIGTRNALIRAIQETSGIAPFAKKDTASARRAMYVGAKTRTIINTSSEAMRKQIGFHRVCATVAVDSPAEAAMQAQSIFKEAGFDAKVHLRPEPEFPEGFIAFMSCEELDGIVLLFWPKYPDPAVVATLDQPEPWTGAELDKAE